MPPLRPAPLLVLLAGLLVASNARGGVLTSATWTQTIEGAAFGGSWTPSEQYGVSFLAGGATAIAVDLDFGLSAEVFVPRGTFLLDRFLRLTEAGPIQLTATSGMAITQGFVAGMLTVRTAVHFGMGVDASMYAAGANTLLRVPVRVGGSGRISEPSFLLLGYYHQAVLDFYRWSAGRRTITGLTSLGDPLPDLVVMGSWGLSPIQRLTFPGGLTTTVGGGGTITLVAPAKIALAPLPGQPTGIRRTTASFTTLTLRFVADHPVPEPNAWLLLGVALLPLAYWRAG